MAKEIEVKAWLDDPDAVRARLDADPGFERLGQSVRDDAYYAAAGAKLATLDMDRDRMVRIRRAEDDGRPGRAHLTAKVRRMRDGVEVNTELETAIEDPDAAVAILSYLGLGVLIRKTKRTTTYRLGEVTVELNHIDGLGAFLECERVLPDDATEADQRRAREAVQAVLERAGVLEDRIEPRRYIDLIRERLGAAGGGA